MTRGQPASRAGDSALRDLLDDMSGLGPITVHPFFGGKSLRWDGVQIAIIMGDAVYLRVDDNSRQDLAAYGAEPFRYWARGRQVTVSRYLELPAAIRCDQALLSDWMRRAQAATPSKHDRASRPRR